MSFRTVRGGGSLQIAICDDDRETLEWLSNAITHFFGSREKARLYFFTDGGELLGADKNFDLIFLDIEMKDLNGIETARRIRISDPLVPIVYVTGYSKYWKSAYQVHAFDFIEKPLKETELHRVLSDFIRSMEKKKQKTIRLSVEDGIAFENTDDIYYFIISKKKRVFVKTRRKEYIAKENLMDIYEKLDKKQFYLSHRSAIVNLNYVDHIRQYDIYLVNGEWLPLSQKKRKDFLLKINEFVCRNGKEG